MGYYIIIILVPSLALVLLSKLVFPRDISKMEWLVQFGAVILSTSIVSLGLFGSQWSTTRDFDILNGQVISKKHYAVSCEHQYVCGTDCVGQGKDEVCTPRYCDEHNEDYNWDVKTSVGTWHIDRLDDQGVRKPPRWANVKIGEPAAATEGVKNYMLIDKDRFKTDEATRAKYKGKLPDYPRPFDYYRLNRVVNDTPQSFNYLNVYLNEQLREWGAKKQLNVILVITNKGEDYWKALREEWRGARKNDVVMVYGIGANNEVKWFEAETFAEGQGNRNLITSLEYMSVGDTLGLNLVQRQFQVILKEYVRKPNAEFEYLAGNYTPSELLVLFIVIVNLIINGGIAFYFKSEKVF